MVVTAAATQLRDRRHLESLIREEDRVALVDVTSGIATIGLMGPRSRELLSRLTDADLSSEEFPFGWSREIEIGAATVRATRITYVGELGWELNMPTEFAPAVFDLIREAGAPLGLRLAGYHAMNSLRIEKAYRHWSHDITPEDTPLEAGLGFCVPGTSPAASLAGKRCCASATRASSAGSCSSCSRIPSPSSTTTSRSGGTACASAGSPPACTGMRWAARSGSATSSWAGRPGRRVRRRPFRDRGRRPARSGACVTAPDVGSFVGEDPCVSAHKSSGHFANPPESVVCGSTGHETCLKIRWIRAVVDRLAKAANGGAEGLQRHLRQLHETLIRLKLTLSGWGLMMPSGRRENDGRTTPVANPILTA